MGSGAHPDARTTSLSRLCVESPALWGTLGRTWMMEPGQGAGAGGAGRSPAWKLLLFCLRSGPGPRPRWTGCRRLGFLFGAWMGHAVSHYRRGEMGATFVSLWPPFLLSLAFCPGSPPWPSWALWGAHAMSRVGSGLSWYQHCPFFITADLPGRGCHCTFSGHEREAPGAGLGPAQGPHMLSEPDRGPERGSASRLQDPQDSVHPGIQKAAPGRHRSPLPPLLE